MMQRSTSFWIAFLLAFALVAGAGAEAGDPAVIWNRTYGESDAYDAAYAIIPGETGFFLAGESAQDAWIIRIASEGSEEWNRTYGGTETDAAHAIIRTSGGNLLLAGNFTFITNETQADTDAWLMEIDPSGGEIWNRTYGGVDVNASAAAVIEAAGGGYVFAGTIAPREGSGSAAWVVRVNETGDEIWNRTFGDIGDNTANALTVLPGGDVVVVGSTESSGAGMADIWVIRLDESGGEVWNRTFGSPDDDSGRAVINTSDGNLLVAGTFTERPDNGTADTDALLIKLTPEGDIIWNWVYGDLGVNETAAAVIETADGGYAFAGETAYPGVDDTDAWLVKTDADGAVAWSRTFGGDNPGDTAASLIESAPGEFVFAGRFNATGKDGAVNMDAWAVKLGPAPMPTPTPKPTTAPIKPPKAPIVHHKPPITAGPTPTVTAKPTTTATVTPTATATLTPTPTPTLIPTPTATSEHHDHDGPDHEDHGFLSGRVWYDLNEDGIPDPGEPGIPGIGVRLIGKRTMFDRTATGPDGSYRFGTTPPSDYQGVEFLVPDGYSCTGSDVHLISGTIAFVESGFGRGPLNVGFIGNYPTNTPAEAYGWVLGSVWRDDDQNGIQDEFIGMTDVEVSLLDTNGDVVASARTVYHDTDTSFYLFGPLTAGEYSLAFTAPDGYAFTVGGGDSHVDPSTGRTTPFMVAGGDAVTRSAGLIFSLAPSNPATRENPPDEVAAEKNTTYAPSPTAPATGENPPDGVDTVENTTYNPPPAPVVNETPIATLSEEDATDDNASRVLSLPEPAGENITLTWPDEPG